MDGRSLYAKPNRDTWAGTLYPETIRRFHLKRNCGRCWREIEPNESTHEHRAGYVCHECHAALRAERELIADVKTFVLQRHVHA